VSASVPLNPEPVRGRKTSPAVPIRTRVSGRDSSPFDRREFDRLSRRIEFEADEIHCTWNKNIAAFGIMIRRNVIPI
jgi:hypothetical protein